MKRSLPLIVCLLLVIVMATSCNSQKSVLSQMQKHAIEHVGDSSGVAKLLSFLPEFDERYVQKMFSLQTSEEPYGLIIYYEPSEEWYEEGMGLVDLLDETFTYDKWYEVDMYMSEEMFTYTEYLYSCIDNLGSIDYRYRTTPSGGVLVEQEYESLFRVDGPGIVSSTSR